MTMRRRDPFQEMRKQVEDLFDSFQALEQELPEPGASAVPVDVSETGKKVTVTADVPGMDSDQIDVTATADTVEIRATHDEEVEEEQQNYYRRERSTHRYHRTVSLPAPVDPDSAEASYENGVLTVELDKSEKTQAREIDIE